MVALIGIDETLNLEHPSTCHVYRFVMSVVWRRLGGNRLLLRSWGQQSCLASSRPSVALGAMLHGSGGRTAPSLPLLPHQHLSTRVVEVRGHSLFSRFWRWLNSVDQMETHEEPTSSEELMERESLLARVQEMYFAKPPQTPDLDFYKESFEVLIKYNDRVGVETLWNFMQEMNIQPDSELVSKVEPYLECGRNVWFQ